MKKRVTFSKKLANGSRRVYVNDEQVGMIHTTRTSTTYTCDHCGSRSEKNHRTTGYYLSVNGILFNNAGEVVRRGEPGYGGSDFWNQRLFVVKNKAVEVLS